MAAIESELVKGNELPHISSKRCRRNIQPIAAANTMKSMIASQVKKRSSKSYLATKQKLQKPSKSFIPGTRCGELYVTNNARQWTFVCTFCNKITRDIGDFVCHIKIKHLDVSDHSSNGSDYSFYDDYNTVNADEAGSHKEQDYLDCGSYLDVHVYTDAEEIRSDDDKQNEELTKDFQITNKRFSELSEITHKQILQEYETKHTYKRSETQKKYAESNVNEADSHANYNEPECASPTLVMKRKCNGETVKNLADHKNADYMKLHCNDELEAEHGNNTCEDEYDEDFDNQLFITPDTVDSHYSSNETRTKRRQIRGTAFCTLCNKTFQYYSLYRNHMIKHSNETPFKCSLCRKGFKSKQAIRYHMHTHQKEKQFKCQLCNASFYTESQFITHILSHENDSTFPCMVCGKILRTEKERCKHLKTHTVERPYRCDFCNKLFRLRHHLSNHLKMHRQYKCDYCKEGFTSAVHLRKPYACAQCKNLSKAEEKLRVNNVLNNSIERTIPDSAEINPLQLLWPLESQKESTSDNLIDIVIDSENGNQSELEEYNESAPSTYSRAETEYTMSTGKRKPYVCKECPRAYSHLSGLNFHIRNKHR